MAKAKTIIAHIQTYELLRLYAYAFAVASGSKRMCRLTTETISHQGYLKCMHKREREVNKKSKDEGKKIK